MKRHLRWLPLLILVTACGYNRIQEFDERVNQQRANIDTELLRRNDLIPNLVATVDASAKFEKRPRLKSRRRALGSPMPHSKCSRQSRVKLRLTS